MTTDREPKEAAVRVAGPAGSFIIAGWSRGPA